MRTTPPLPLERHRSGRVSVTTCWIVFVIGALFGFTFGILIATSAIVGGMLP